MLWLRRFFSSIEYPVLGRWALNYNDNMIHRKVDLANEDHCGCCNSVPEIRIDIGEIDEDYYRPFLY